MHQHQMVGMDDDDHPTMKAEPPASSLASICLWGGMMTMTRGLTHRKQREKPMTTGLAE